MSADTPGQAFAAHPWTVVLQARRQDAARAMETLSRLCQTYWYPLYAYVRVRGHSPEEARELTHEFFSRLLHSKTLAYMRKDCGKFRSFLLSAMNHFLVDEARKGRLALPDALSPQSPLDEAEKVFEQNWALAVAGAAYDRLRREYEQSGRGEIFAVLKSCLTSARSSLPYADLAARLGLAEDAVPPLVQSLRLRCHELRREELAGLVATPAELEEELRCLFHPALA